ncbi:hypothetical protein [Streptomyces sp. NPDC088847]|uniref:hypothetical protein n=1 Tax=Streptomyces sp. NPDC088847 TaxID=3365909 RepID=UPI0038162A1E
MSSLLAAAALAEPSQASASTGGNPVFQQQARRLGLTAAETHSMQSRVDAYINKAGGTQVDINKIKLDDQGSYALLPLPGEKKARDLSAAAGGSYRGCPYYYFCMWQSVTFEGTMNYYTKCGIDWPVYWSGYGSWVNNQTPGTRVQFKDIDYVTRWTDAGARSEDDSADWTWVYQLQIC